MSLNVLVYCFTVLTHAEIRLVWPFMFGYFMIYMLFQVYFVWYLYCRFAKRSQADAPQNCSVDVFLPAYNEPMWIVERTVKAAKEMTYPHRTYLLDDSLNRDYEKLAEKYGTGYLTREGNKDFKAGNINAALKKTDGDFVAIFDIDHAPHSDFLDLTLGYFKDPEIGFVQGMQTYGNARDGLIAAASVQTSLEYFNITGNCKDRVDAMSHHGSNAVIRRAALESIGGYQPGLAEDLETSLRLHAKGWKSAYVCEPLAPGLAPSTFRAFCRQQLKWSRGVFEAAIRSFSDGTFFKLTRHQQLAYSVRFSYYLVGFSALLGMLLTLYYLFKPSAAIYEGFMARFLPLTALFMVIRCFVLRAWGTEPAARKGVHFKGSSLVFSIWPVYLLALICAVIRIKIPFMSTPKERDNAIESWIVLPQLVMLTVMAAGITWKVLHWQTEPAPLTLLTAFLIVGQQWILFVPLQQMLGNAFHRIYPFEPQPEFKPDLESDV